VVKAAQAIGRGAKEYALHVKGQPIPMHEPRYKQGMGVGYALSPTGADHCHNIHDNLFSWYSPQLEEAKVFGILEPLPSQDLSPAKMRLLLYQLYYRHLLDSLVLCFFIPMQPNQIVELVQGVTGWNSSLWELMKAGERCLTLTRLFNLQEGWRKEDDTLPRRFFTPFSSGPLAGVAIEPQKFYTARDTFYSMAGWDKERGIPSLEKLQELELQWAVPTLLTTCKEEAQVRDI
jgi:aldehyde:ferredoxin oxidoreductase